MTRFHRRVEPQSHETLLSHRTADGRGVALLTVKGKPERER
ncbi:hypothetical protein [Roseateles noduli]